MGPLILALDSGTSVVKAIAFEADGTQLSSASRPNTYHTLPGGGAEQDMERTWTDAAAVLAELAAKIGGRDIAALAVTGQGDGTWLVDSDGAPVGRGWLWLDARAASIVEELKASGGAEAAFVYTGTGLTACQQIPQLLWMKRHEPARIAQAAASLHPKDFLHLRLTGVVATSPDEGSVAFGDFRTREYRDEVLRALGAGAFRRLLPPMLDGTRHAHKLLPAAAAATGLPAGLPVVLGALDVVCCALGAGVYGAESDTGITIVGSTGMHMRLVADIAHATPSPLLTGYCLPFPVPGHTLQAQTNMAATLNIDWVVNLAIEAAALATGGYVSREAVLRALDDRVGGARPGAIVYHPYISTAGERGPFTDANARASVLGLDQDVGLITFARGVYEGLCFAARDCFAAIGGAPDTVLISGGAARSQALREILAAVLHRTVRAAAQIEAGAAGAAMMAAVQAGIFPDMAACAAVWTAPRLGPELVADPALAALYDGLFPVYREATHVLPPLWRHMQAARGSAPGGDHA